MLNIIISLNINLNSSSFVKLIVRVDRPKILYVPFVKSVLCKLLVQSKYGSGWKMGKSLNVFQAPKWLSDTLAVKML